MSRVFCDYVLDLLSAWKKVEARRLFGGFGLYCDSIIFAIILGSDILYFKVTEETKPVYEKAGCKPFSYKKTSGKVVELASYFEVPAVIMDDGDELIVWADTAFRALGKTANKPKRKTRI